MAVVRLKVGLRWGRLRVTGMGTGERTLDHGGGVTETLMQAPYAECRCLCGGVVRLWVAEWKGVRRGVADCGCGRAREDGANSITSVSP